MTDIPAILQQRTADYGQHGSFADKARFAQALKSLLRDTRSWEEESTDEEREAMDMICHKIARLACGNPHHVDSWRDIAGYAMLVVQELERDTDSFHTIKE